MEKSSITIRNIFKTDKEQMKTLENENDKINKICEILKKETLEPAENEALKIIQEAKVKAEKILEEAESQAKWIKKESDLVIEKEKQMFHAVCQKAASLTLEHLRQTIDNQFLKPALGALIEKSSIKSDAKALCSRNGVCKYPIDGSKP